MDFKLVTWYLNEDIQVYICVFSFRCITDSVLCLSVSAVCVLMSDFFSVL
jgi:hypothetical protein